METLTLDIAGYNGEPVPNELVTSGTGSRHLAIMLPGLGYRSSLPALLYPGKLLVERGADLLRVDYDYLRPELAGDGREQTADRLTGDVTAAVRAGLAMKSYERITLIGKSLGTLAMAYLLGSEPSLALAECIWLTPLVRDERVGGRIMEVRPRSLFVIGTEDAHYDPALLAELREATAGELVVLEGANHGVEVPGDVMTTLDRLGEMMRGIDRFIRANDIERIKQTGSEQWNKEAG